MPVDTEFHSLATSLFHKHGEGALAYALKNAQAVSSENAELKYVWTSIAKKIENLISATSPDCRESRARHSADFEC